jgi:protein-tyrosine phosphatase
MSWVTPGRLFLQKFFLMTRILFVCLGNICRSPLAEAIFVHQIREKGLEKTLTADSCGTANYHVGMAPDPRTIRNAEKNGITITHLGRQFAVDDFDAFDFIIPMDASNRSNILRLPGASSFREKVIMMRSFDPHQKGADVPDPYYGTEKDFQEVFDILNRSVGGLIQFLQSKT